LRGGYRHFLGGRQAPAVSDETGPNLEPKFTRVILTPRFIRVKSIA
jgi:hypothetical protein